ncbi:MAG: hypothetical protein QF357_01425 [Dehalococcoidia bacterium]|jgi:hypothetical protein|nr:hypothetical protein [Dehalococcoidia bacterium]
MQYLVGFLVAVLVMILVYRAGRRSGYEAGRIDERKEWSTKIRELDD